MLIHLILSLTGIYAQQFNLTSSIGSIEGFANGNATTARFRFPFGIAIQKSGDLFVADSGNHLIRRITPSGIVSTFAGSTNPGGTDGNGTDASFFTPVGLVFDSAGNLFVSELEGNRIRKITPTGNVTLFAGSTMGASGLKDGMGTSALFSAPLYMTIDNMDNLYVSDYLNAVIRKISPTGMVTTFAGSGTPGNINGIGTAASFNRPVGITRDQLGDLYVTEYPGNQVRKISSTAAVSFLAGSEISGNDDGNGAAASFNTTFQITAHTDDFLYVGDSFNGIRKVSKVGRVTTVRVVGGSIRPTQMLYQSNGNAVMVDSYGHKIMTFQTTCTPGQYRNSTNVCLQCPSDTFSIETDSISCTPCNNGTFSNPGSSVCRTANHGQTTTVSFTSILVAIVAVVALL